MSDYATYQDLTVGLESKAVLYTLKRLWRTFVARNRRVLADIALIELELAQKKPILPRLPLFPRRPYKTSTAVLFCVFAYFVLAAAFITLVEFVVPHFR